MRESACRGNGLNCGVSVAGEITMKLLFSPMSPYARKVRIVTRELGLLDQVQEVSVSLSPVNPNPDVTRNNPLGKIPVLVLDDDSALYDSPVICEYLDHLGGPRLIPQPGDARWIMLRQQALADGLLDAAVLMRYETVTRPAAFRWLEWLDAQKSKILQALDALERDAGALAGKWDLGAISVACALGYLDFRFPGLSWRPNRTPFGPWDEDVSQRMSFRATG